MSNEKNQFWLALSIMLASAFSLGALARATERITMFDKAKPGEFDTRLMEPNSEPHSSYRYILLFLIFSTMIGTLIAEVTHMSSHDPQNPDYLTADYKPSEIGAAVSATSALCFVFGAKIAEAYKPKPVIAEQPIIVRVETDRPHYSAV